MQVQDDAINEQNIQDCKDKMQEVAACFTQRSLLCACSGKNGKNVKLACGHEIPMISPACTMGNQMPVRDGLVGNKHVGVLRDSGCSRPKLTVLND